MKRKAFTLLELLVVLAVIAIISSMTFGVIGNIAESNRKLTCTANLAQIYGAARLYAQDYNGQLPYYKPDASIVDNTTTTPPSIDNNISGLWMLVRYPTGLKSGYLRSEDKFHCPSDRFKIPGAAMPADSGIYNSYQQVDDVPVLLSNSPPVFDNNPRTYATFRTDVPSLLKRQLTYTDGSTVNETRRVSDTTVVTWCRYHRRLKSDASGSTHDLASTKDRDNVLFYDGRVQSLPTTQLVSEAAPKTGTGECSGWKRVPIQLENSLASASECLPSN
jgi:prepilin-type N-terminal cleavage/methylation domain-containing protein